MKYRKKAVVIDAIQWTGDNLKECQAFLGTDFVKHVMDRGLNGKNEIHIKTLEGVMIASLNTFLIRGVAGEHYPCQPEIFYQTYTLAGGDEILEGVDFSRALQAVKRGSTIHREGWNGKGQYVFLMTASELKQGLKNVNDTLNYNDVLVLKTAQNKLYMGWTPSIGDLMACDWVVN